MISRVSWTKRGSEIMKRYALFTLLLFAIPASAAQRPSQQSATQTISPAPSFEPVTHERLLNSDAEPENWLMYSGNYFSQRYSGLDQINTENAGQLEMQWAFQLRALDRAETTPLVVDGVMYVTEAPSNVIALDARTGAQYWRYNHNLPDDLNYCCGRNNRGVAVLGDRLYMGTLDAHLVALDAKMNFDDNALDRHPEIVEMRDLSEEDPTEIEASRHRLSYIKLDGDVGCMVNGAGLAMATMDIIKMAGGSPANFLDVGGGANLEQVKNAFRILLLDENLKAVLINIFGGIVRCDVVAEGVVQAVKEEGVKVPVVVRLEGTNVEKGREILKDSGLDFLVATDMADAAHKVVQAV